MEIHWRFSWMVFIIMNIYGNEEEQFVFGRSFEHLTHPFLVVKALKMFYTPNHLHGAAPKGEQTNKAWLGLLIMPVRTQTLDIICIFQVTQLENADDIALDWVANRIYWIDASSNRIMMSDLTGSNVITIVDTHLHIPLALAVDPHNK